MSETIMNFLNIFSINIAIIISSILTYYFITLNIATKHVDSSLSLTSFDPGDTFSPAKKILGGIILGIITFILSYNSIPVAGASFGIDMSYALIYLVIIYGTTSQGIIATIVLEILKAIYRFAVNHYVSPIAWINGLLFICIIVAFSYYLKQKKYTMMKTHLIFVTGFLLLRLTFFSFYLNSFFNPKKLIEFGFHLIVYTIVFLITTFIINIAISLSQSVKVYQTAAITDELTNVYNRSAFNFFIDYLSDLTEKDDGTDFSLALIDVDKFKEINDTYGHPVGDQILKFISYEMQTLSLPGQHYICRIGGDEFAIIHYQTIQKAEIFYEELFKRLEKNPYMVKDEPINFSVSIGLTHFDNQQINSKELIEISDKALYKAKKKKGNSLIISDSI